MPPRPSITLYYDIISPWARLAYLVLRRLEQPWGFDLALRPRFLGGVFAASDNKAPADVAAKRVYFRDVDLPRCSRYFDVPYRYPDPFPVNTLNIIRFLRIVEHTEPALLRPLTDLWFEEMWGVASRPAECAQPAHFRTVIPPALVSDSKLEEWIKLSQSTENKDKVKSDGLAIVKDEGAFGVPWIVVERPDGKKEPFFGSDRFEHIAAFLGKHWQGPMPPASSPML